MCTNSCPFGKTEIIDGNESPCRCHAVEHCSDRNRSIKAFPGMIIGGIELTKPEELEIAPYAVYLCYLGVTNSSDVFSNHDENHAKIILSKLLQSAKGNIKIYCSGSDLNFFNQPGSPLRDAFHDFLKNLENIQVEVLLENCSQSAIALLKKLNIPDQICIKVSSPELKRKIEYQVGQRDFHFMIVDGQSYRYEYNTANHAAICSFDDRPQCQQLSLAFDYAFKTSTEI